MFRRLPLGYHSDFIWSSCHFKSRQLGCLLRSLFRTAKIKHQRTNAAESVSMSWHTHQCICCLLNNTDFLHNYSKDAAAILYSSKSAFHGILFKENTIVLRLNKLPVGFWNTDLSTSSTVVCEPTNYLGKHLVSTKTKFTQGGRFVPRQPFDLIALL